MHLVLGIAVTTAFLIGLGLGALVGALIGWLLGRDTAELKMNWDASVPAARSTLHQFTNFTVHLTATFKGKTYNVPNQEVRFEATTPDVTTKQPPNGIVKTGADGKATCAFAGQRQGTTHIEARTTAEGNTITASTGPYETVPP